VTGRQPCRKQREAQFGGDAEDVPAQASERLLELHDPRENPVKVTKWRETLESEKATQKQ
jgi:hypothetical protein